MPPSRPQEPRTEIRLTAGPLDAEGAILRDLEERLHSAPQRWADPLVLVVPSRTLRDHLRARIVAQHGPILGVRATTLFGLALEITEDVAGRQLAGRDLFPLFARRLARDEKALRRALEPLNDGYSSLLGPVRDLLDAGFDPALAEGMTEALGSEGRPEASKLEVDRAQGLVQVAAGTLLELDRLGAGRRSTLLTSAAEQVRQLGRQAFKAESVWVYGFADASGVARDLIEALLDRFAGRLYLDQPADPANRSELDAGVVFTQRFRERIESTAPVVHPTETARESGSTEPTSDPVSDPVSDPSPTIELFRALGSDGEVREVGRRILDLLDRGVSPERIAVVARQLTPYSRAVRHHFTSLGLPYSAYGALGAKDRLGRRGEALADLLDRGSELSVERWLELLDRRIEGTSRADLRTGFATLGTGRLREAAALAADPYRRQHKLKLPVRHGFDEPSAEGQDQRGLRLRYRYLSAAALAEATDSAAALADHLGSWQQMTELHDHLGALRSLLEGHLGWSTERPESALLQAVEGLWFGLPGDFRLSYDEFCEAGAARLREFGNRPLGGFGGGIQVLDVVEARGTTSEHLFLIGLNRGVFPRVVTEDPLLPDSLRRVLSREGFGVLPDLPNKLAGFDEERFLFAQLMASSPNITLSWQDTDDDQMPLAPSPLVERLRWGAATDDWQEPELALSIIAQKATVPRSPLESAVTVALEGSRAGLAEILPLLQSGEHPTPAAAAAARMAVLGELDPDFSAESGRAAAAQLGPYYGFLGTAQTNDPRAEQKLFVTTLEGLSGCPWQVVLRRLLGLEPVPDPLAALPGITPLLIGALVHDVLEQIVRRGLTDDPKDLAQARLRIPQAIPWPESKELDAILYRTAEALCRKQGIAVDGFARVLSMAVAPHLEVARQLDWSVEGALHVLGVELFGELPVEDVRGVTRSVHFRADRLDLGAEGLTLTDYKTGRRAVSSAKQDRARRRHLVESVWRGERLQAVAYALAAGQPGDSGRYLFIGPEVSDDPTLRDVRIDAGDNEIEQAFRRAAGAAIATWDSGGFFPRIVVPQRDEEPIRCSYCEVRDACLRGDSGARRRLRNWVESQETRFVSGGALEPHELTLLTLWNLPVAAKR